jgi:hypothetical protein
MFEASRSTTKQCAGTRKDGAACTAREMGPGDYCFAHAPDRAAERAAARERGGRGRATRARLDRLVPATLRPMISTLLGALDEVHAGTLDPKQASAMAALAGAVTRAYSVGVLEQRVADLEAAQEAGEGGRGA